MPTTFVKNQNVRLKVVTPEGPVAALRMDEDGQFFYLVQWTDPKANPNSVGLRKKS
jgi:hypothetical protein